MVEKRRTRREIENGFTFVLLLIPYYSISKYDFIVLII